MLGKDLIYSAYGLKTASRDDPIIETVEHGLEAALAAMIPGRFLVDAFPIRELQRLDVRTLVLMLRICSEIYPCMVSWCRLET